MNWISISVVMFVMSVVAYLLVRKLQKSNLPDSYINLSMQVGYKLAPNPGYISAVNASSISVVTLFSAYFFKDELTLKKIIGVAGVTAGLILLFI